MLLTSKEFDLLLLLAAHPNRVFTKDELFERVWGLESIGDSSTVTVHIRRLREKIELDPSNPQYIDTVWGVGYRLKV
ncbi:Alkaline phosphatase synthesis transcriptional regulatory protein SphR [compost metagenome]